MNFGRSDGALVGHQVHGIWREAEESFDATLLNRRENTLTLTIPSGSLNSGIIYDYIRLELDEK